MFLKIDDKLINMEAIEFFTLWILEHDDDFGWVVRIVLANTTIDLIESTTKEKAKQFLKLLTKRIDFCLSNNWHILDIDKIR